MKTLIFCLICITGSNSLYSQISESNKKSGSPQTLPNTNTSSSVDSLSFNHSKSRELKVEVTPFLKNESDSEVKSPKNSIETNKRKLD